MLCVVCKERETDRKVDKWPVCDACLLRDAVGGKIVKSYARYKLVKSRDGGGRFR